MLLPAHLLAFALLAAGAAGPVGVRADEYLLIRNAKNPTAQLTPGQLRDLMIGRAKQWPSGAVFQLVLPDDPSAPLDWLGARWLSTTSSLLFAKIRQEVFKGEMRRPLVADDDLDAIAKVKAHEGGLALVSATSKLPAGVALVTIKE